MPSEKLEKPVLNIQTPKSATFPSEIPLKSFKSETIKQEDPLSTPITPPVAYTDFIKALTPIISSPMSAAPTIFSERMSETSTPITATTAPSTSSSFCAAKHDATKSPAAGAIPPSPFLHPRSAQSPSNSLRHLRIPASPAFSPGTDSPRSANMRSPFSPADWSLDPSRHFDFTRTGNIRPVSVRSVVTRKVVYKRSPPLEPAPKGKKRKLGSVTPEPEKVKTAAVV